MWARIVNTQLLIHADRTPLVPLQYLHAFLNEVTILVPVLNDAKHTFAIYTPERIKKRWPIRVAAATEEEMHDWVKEAECLLWSISTKSVCSCKQILQEQLRRDLFPFNGACVKDSPRFSSYL